MKATFLDHFGAYFIDIIIISIIASLICLGLPETDKEIEKKITELNNQYIAKEINQNKYLSEYSNLLYANQKDRVLETGINLAITIAYFVIFQYMNKGQTIGKKLLKIKVVDKDTKKPATIVKCLLRSIITLGIASSALNIILINTLSKKSYMYSYLTISIVESIFIFITIIFILYRKDGRGLHDLIANTTVIKEGRG